MFNMECTGKNGSVYQIENSLLFEAATTSKLSRTPSTTTETKKGTLSVWCKRTAFTDGALLRAGAHAAGYYDVLILQNNAPTYWNWDGALTDWLEPSDEIYDVSSFVHLVIAIDTTQAVESDRVKIYIDNRRLVDFTTANYPVLNQTTRFNSTELHVIGDETTVTTRKLNSYIADYIWIAGQQLTPDSFGEWHPSNPRVWRPIDPSGLNFSADANSFWLNFADGTSATTLGYDVSGNGNHFTPSGITTANQVTDTPTRNCAVWDCTYFYGTFSNGARTVTRTTADRGYFATLPIFPDTGVWYTEVEIDALGSSANSSVGLAIGSADQLGVGGTANQKYMYRKNGDKFFNGTATAYGATWTAGDVISVILDTDNWTIEFWKNGVSQGTAFTSVKEDVLRITCADDAAADTFTIVSDPNDFNYTPPAGALPLISQSYPMPTIPDTSTVFDIVRWNGSSPSSQAVSTTNKADLLYFADISFTWKHGIITRDSTSGYIAPPSDAAEYAAANIMDSWGATSGFTLSGHTHPNDSYGPDVYTGYVFTEDPDFLYTTIFNGDGANGWKSLVLNKGPSFILMKNLDTAATGWVAWFDYNATNTFATLDTNAAETVDSTVFQAQDPGLYSDWLYLGTNSRVNENTKRILLMAFCDRNGSTKAFTFNGNANADGPVTNLGFCPRWIIFKNMNAVQNWLLFDAYENTISDWGNALRPDLFNTQISVPNFISITSTGFKVTTTDARINGSSHEIVGFAIADRPLALINNGAL